MSHPSIRYHPSLSRIRIAPIAVCLSALFSSVATSTLSASSTPHEFVHNDEAPKKSTKSPEAQVVPVLNCTDHDPGSLRDVITNQAQTGATVDLSQLAMTCATITLTTGEISISQHDLTLLGPAPGTPSVTISGGNHYRVLDHQGDGTLTVTGLTITEGYYKGNNAKGGCVNSNGTVYLNHSVVSACVLDGGVGGGARGGGVYAYGAFAARASVVSNNSARATVANGGGVFARSGLLTKYSTLTGNDAACAVGFGGGAYVGAYGDTNVFYSTIDTNSSCQHAGGLYVSSSSSHHLFISNSTISGNWTDAGDGGGVLFGNVPATILNSTIALNHAGDSGGGIAQCCVSVAITFESSIVANNTAGDPAMSDDISLSPSSNITGHDNLVRTSSPQPPSGVIKVAADPKLKLLQLNGGITKTHALFPDSPARGQGNDLGNSQTDQRGPGYPRATGASGMVDIGAFEFDSIFADNFES